MDIPLYFENKINKKGDVILYIDAKDDKIITRLKKRPNYNKKLLDEFKKIQKKSDFKKKNLAI